MTKRSADSSTLLKAQLAGVFYLLNIVTGAAAAVYLARGLVSIGETAQLVAAFSYVVVTLLFYALFKPVNSSLSLIAALFSFAGCASGVYNLYHPAPMLINALVFFGVYCLLIGYLILRSTFLPSALGVLMIIAGLAWLTFLSRPLAHALSPFIFLPGLIGETSLTVWLLAKGVNVQRWNEQAGIAETSGTA